MISLAATSLAGACASGSEAIEDNEHDVFYTDDSKSDGFGVEDGSPDGDAVLELASTAEASELVAAGLTQRVADAIVAGRAEPPDERYTDLAQLDAVPYVGPAVFAHLLAYVTDNRLFDTAIRIPLLVERAGNLVPITTFNAAASEAGLEPFARYVFVQSDGAHFEKLAKYDDRLAELAAATGTRTGTIVRGVRSLADFARDSLTACYIGDPSEVAPTAAIHTGELMNELYMTWGYRAGEDAWAARDAQVELDVPEWESYSTTSKDVMIFSTGVEVPSYQADISLVPPCRAQ